LSRLISLDEQFKLQNKLKSKYSLKKIKFGKDYEFFPKIPQSEKSWEEENFEQFIEENKLIILTLQDNILKSNDETQNIFIKMLDDALKRQEFAIIAGKYYPIIDLLINAILTKDKDEFFQALFMMKELHKKCMELETKISRKLTKIIGERIKMTEEDYNAMLK